MQTTSIYVTAENVASTQTLFSNTHVTHVTNSTVFLTDTTVYVAASDAVKEELVGYVSNVLYN